MRLIVLGLVLIQCCGGENDHCKKEVLNVIAVERCPKTEEEWEDAALEKNCAKLVTESRQNCSNNELFTYHCVINSYRTGTVEMCSPSKFIFGGCTEFNDVGQLIQLHNGSPCDDIGFPKCAGFYNSTKAYSYQGCYELVKKPTSDKPLEESGVPVLYIILPIIGILFVVCIGIIVKQRKYIYNSRSRNETFERSLPREEVKLLSENTNQEARVILLSTETGTATDKWVRAALKTTDDLSEENKDESQRFVKSYEKIDKYFFETDTYKEGEKRFNRRGIVIWKGYSGCGKTMAAIHLIRKQLTSSSNPAWTLRKIRSCQELSYLKNDAKTLVFIDNIFFRRTMDLDLQDWWKELQNVYDVFFQNDTYDRLRFVITAQTKAIERARSLMGKSTPILNDDHHIDATLLTKSEKEKIFLNQIDFAKEKRQANIPKKDAEFLDKIKTAEGPIGFPLCAHLFVCSLEYQKSGVDFFSRPTEYLKYQIKDEIENDKSNRTKSLFFVLFFYERNVKLGNSEKLQVKSDYQCRRLLERISKDLVEKFKPFEFKELDREAERLVGTFLKKESDNRYSFIHDSVYDAVGALWCETYVAETARYFPLDIIQNHGFEKATNDQIAILATRLLYDTLHQRLSLVFACKLFKRQIFVDLFISELAKKDSKTIINFLTVTNDSSPVKLPSMFWTAYNKLTYLTEKLYFNHVIKENIEPEYQLYVSLYGECCSKKESILNLVNGMLQDNIEGVKKRVREFKDCEHNLITHLVVTSVMSDEFASLVVGKLMKEKFAVDARNSCNVTPLMLAVKQLTKRKNVIKTLMEKKQNLNNKDNGGANVFHHCLSSCHDDETCAEYLKILLTGSNMKKCLSENDNNGDTALCKAARETKHSRICSILTLVEHGGTDITDTIDAHGFSPLHLSVKNLKGESTYVELECCVRVILFLAYGGSPDKKSDLNKNAIEECRYERVEDVLKNPGNEEIMIEKLDEILEEIDGKNVCRASLPFFPNEIGLDLERRIEQAIYILQNKTFV